MKCSGVFIFVFLFVVDLAAQHPRETMAQKRASPDVDSGAGINLALYQPTATHTVESDGLEGIYAVDGDYATRWSSGFFGPQWIVVDLRAIYRIDRVTIIWEGTRGANYEIQVSRDSAIWETIKAVTGNTSRVNHYAGLSGVGRYIRIYGTAHHTINGYSVCEFEVYGSYSEDDQKAGADFGEEGDRDHTFLNPAQSILTVKGVNPDSQVTMMNVLTHEIIRLITDDEFLDVCFLEEGTYLVQFYSGSKLITDIFSKL